MGFGAVMGAVSGVSSIIGSRKQSKAASRDMASAQAAWDKGEGYLEDMLNWGFGAGGMVGSGGAGGVGTAAEGLDYAKQQAALMQSLGEEYGEFAQGLWSNWEENYGSIRSNLVDYYENLDPDKYAVNAKAEIAQELDKQFQQFDQQAAQSGIYTSGMKLQAQKENQYAKAQNFAQADIAAPEKVAAMQSQFYNTTGAAERGEAMGAMNSSYNLQGQMLGQGGQMVGGAYNSLAQMQESAAQRAMTAGISNRNFTQGMYGSAMDFYNNQGNAYAGSSAAYGEAAGKNFGSGVSQIGGALGSAFPDFKLF